MVKTLSEQSFGSLHQARNHNPKVLRKKKTSPGLPLQNENNYALPQRSSMNFKWVNTFRALRIVPGPEEALGGSCH